MRRNKMEFRNLTKLITELKNDAKSDWAIQEDMASMYQQDADDAQEVMDLINAPKDATNNYVRKYINRLDAVIREAIIIALAKDLGSDWVASELHWEVN